MIRVNLQKINRAEMLQTESVYADKMIDSFVYTQFA